MSAGLAFMTGPRGQPMRAGASIVDVGAAAYGVIAVLAALQQRAQHRPRAEDHLRPLRDDGVLGGPVAGPATAATGEPSVPMPEIRQGTRMGWGVYQLFTAADGEQVFIGITSNAHWERFCKEFGLDDLLADERLNDNAKRVAARDWLPARIGEEMLQYSERGAGRAAGARADPVRAAAPARSARGRSAPERVGAVHGHAAARPAARPSCRSCRCAAPPSSSACAARRRSWASTRARCSQEFGLSKDEIDALASRRVIG